MGASVLPCGTAPDVAAEGCDRLAEGPACVSVVPGISVSVSGFVRAASLRRGVPLLPAFGLELEGAF
jgi:hypothetical protein